MGKKDEKVARSEPRKHNGPADLKTYSWDDICPPLDDPDESGPTFSYNLAGDNGKLWPKADDNHDVLRRLEAANVVDANCSTDSEAGEVFIEFKNEVAARCFLDRLNLYLVNRANAVREARKALKKVLDG